ncbi:MAG: hypothetical protein IPL58_09060 [Betaproteobacteria bacterium]|uniref:AsmA-like C-terminal domain-containing protein n=1 Tax=Candidatus Proximibacter danicus TaxID=2954365 RepID=A0A9D7K430_9PROT|nr:hypothetical protein [Candidatus Proximibacter danicus]
MDANLIYEKTATGEEAVRQRTRVVQRNTRMVLILVDSKSTVAELCEKTGNVQLVETALMDLERDGLIVPKLAQDSVWEQSKKLAEEIKAAAINRLGRNESASGQKPEHVPEINPPSLVPPPFSIAPLSVAPHSIMPSQLSGASAPFSTFGGAPSIAPPSMRAAKAEAPKESYSTRLSGFFSKKVRGEDDSSIKPIRRGVRRAPVSLPIAITLGAIGILAVIALVSVFYPYDSHRPQLEAALSRVLGQPVRIAAVRAVFSPQPAISLEGVAGQEGSGIQAARIRLIPEVLTLLGSHPVFSVVEVEAAYLQAKALADLPHAASKAMAPGGPATVRLIRMTQLEVDILGLKLADLQSEIRPDESGKLLPLTFSSSDRSLKIVFKPQSPGFVAEFEAFGWQPKADSSVRFDSLQGVAAWDGASLSIRALDARIFDGAILGELAFSLGPQPQMAGEISVKHMNLVRLGGAMGYGNQFEGELVGGLKFSANAQAWRDILPAASGDGTFSLHRGVLGGFDLVEAMRRGKGSVLGGATRYEQLTGRLVISPQSIRFADLVLSSGLLRSGGYLEVARNDKLGGRLDVEMRGSANVIRMPIAASGSMKNPVLQGGR